MKQHHTKESHYRKKVVNMFIVKGYGSFSDRTSKKGAAIDFDRKIYCDMDCSMLLCTNGNHKYNEKIIFRNPKQNPTKYAIAIGGKPRLCKCDQVDTTNAYLSEYFYHKNYKGYILINLFTVLTEGIDSNSNYYNLNDYLFYNPFDMANYLKISLSIILALLILYLICFYFGETTILNLLCMIYGL